MERRVATSVPRLEKGDTPVSMLHTELMALRVADGSRSPARLALPLGSSHLNFTPPQ